MTGFGWISARLSIHGSRGRTQQIAPGSTPRASSQMQASVAVLPEPTTTYWLGASSRCTRSLTGTTRAPSPTANFGGSSAGMSGARYRASTTRQPSGTENAWPDTRETTVRSPTYDEPGKNSTRPDPSSRSASTLA